MPYTFQRTIQKIVVPLGKKIEDIKKKFLIKYYIDFMDKFISWKCLVKLMFDLSRLMLNFFLIKENSTDDKETLISK